ncbi:MAG: methylated-DNA--[protein]-cysteine S-methyltransferase [Oceanipulchritudo sp.]
MSSLPDSPSRIVFDPSAHPGGSNGTLLSLFPVETPAGPGWLGIGDDRVAWLSFGSLDREAVEQYWQGPVDEKEVCPLSNEELMEAAMGHVPLTLAPAGTPFQLKVWRELLETPFGITRTYGEISEAIGSPGSARAVASAVASNPIAWLIPCHRILPASGEIGSYRWGRPAKQSLLVWENLRIANPSKDFVPEKREKLESMLLKAQRFEDIAKMAGDIAHDLNNLIAPIRMATELLKQKIEDDSLNRYVSIIESSTGRARSVIQEILAFSRETEGNEKETLHVKPLIRELETMVRETFPERLQLVFDYEPESNPVIVRIDHTQLHRAILNILVNARDAIKGEGRIGVRVSKHELKIQVCVGERCLLPGSYGCISISDTGSGIPQDIRDRIFDPFFTTKPKEQGTGLGLASVYGIIARAGGFIDVESDPGKGSTFHVFLPQMEAVPNE